MAINYEFERHLRVAGESGNETAVNLLRSLRAVFNSLRKAGLVEELPRETQSVKSVEIDMSFGKRLAEYRKRQDWTQKAFAQRIKLDHYHFNKIERGKRNPPGVGKVLSIVRELKLGPAEAEELVELAGYSSRFLKVG